MRYKYDQFNKDFKYASEKTSHVNSIHKQIKYECTICGYKAPLQHNLTRHIKSVHEGITHSCTICIFKTNHKGNLTYYMSKHKGKKYSCHICNIEHRI